MSGTWYCLVNGREIGPLWIDELRRLARQNMLAQDDLVRQGFEGCWLPAVTVGGLFVEPAGERIVPEPARNEPSRREDAPPSSNASRNSSSDSPVEAKTSGLPFSVARERAHSPLTYALGLSTLATFVMAATSLYLLWDTKHGGSLSPVGSTPHAPLRTVAAKPIAQEVDLAAEQGDSAQQANPINPHGQIAQGRRSKRSVTARPMNLPPVNARPAGIEEDPAWQLALPPTRPAEAADGAAAQIPPPRQAPVELARHEAPTPHLLMPRVQTRLEQAIQTRWLRFRKLIDRRQELLAERAKIQKHKDDLNQQLTDAKSEYARLSDQATTLQQQLQQLAQQIGQIEADLRYQKADALAASNRLLGELRANEQLILARYNTLDQEMAKLNRQATALMKQIGERDAEMQASYRRAEELRDEWLDVVDPLADMSRLEHQAAIPWFDEWIASDATNAGARIARAIAYANLTDYGKALDDLNRVVEMDGGFLLTALSARGGLFLRLERDHDAAADFMRVFKIEKNDWRAHLFRGTALCAQQKYLLAEKDFRAAIQIAPDRADGYRLLALLYATSPGFGSLHGKKAVEYAERACSLTNQGDWSSLRTLAAAHAEAGDFEQAKAWAGKAALLAPAEKCERCLAQQRLYTTRQPLRIPWE
jgi:tetratricopeptide (TPR) repeat protein